MNKTNLLDASKELMAFVQAAEELSLSLENDLIASDLISNDTIKKLSDFKQRRVDLSTMLDIANGVN